MCIYTRSVTASRPRQYRLATPSRHTSSLLYTSCQRTTNASVCWLKPNTHHRRDVSVVCIGLNSEYNVFISNIIALTTVTTGWYKSTLMLHGAATSLHSCYTVQLQVYTRVTRCYTRVTRCGYLLSTVNISTTNWHFCKKIYVAGSHSHLHISAKLCYINTT